MRDAHTWNVNVFDILPKIGFVKAIKGRGYHFAQRGGGSNNSRRPNIGCSIEYKATLYEENLIVGVECAARDDAGVAYVIMFFFEW